MADHVESDPGGNLIGKLYDGDGKRIRTDEDTGPVWHVYDAAVDAPELLLDRWSVQTGGEPTDRMRKFVWGLEGPVYAVDDDEGVRMYHTDVFGSIRTVTDESATVVWMEGRSVPEHHAMSRAIERLSEMLVVARQQDHGEPTGTHPMSHRLHRVPEVPASPPHMPLPSVPVRVM